MTKHNEEVVAMKRTLIILSTLLIIFCFCGSGYADIGFESEKPIPAVDNEAIIIDGDFEDWEGIPVFLMDPRDDSTCAGDKDKTDIKAIYLAKDGTYLYWRMEMYNGFLLDESKFPMIHFYDDFNGQNGLPDGGVTWQMWDDPESYGAVLVNEGDPDWTWFPKYVGVEYGIVSQMSAEGKIPLSLFDEYELEINRVEGYYYAGEPNVPCDTAVWISSFAGNNFGYYFVRHFTHEDGSETDQLAFNLLDETGAPILEDIVNYVQLIGPDGVEVSVSDLEFFKRRIAFPQYECGSSQWIYQYDQNGELFQDWADYYATIQGPLEPGDYHLIVTDIFGKQYEGICTFNGQENLPVVSSSSFKHEFDNNGNLIWKWELPNPIDSSLQTNGHPLIDIYKHREYVGSLWITEPSHIESLFIPSDVFEMMKEEGNKFELSIQLWTTDSNNATSSKPKKLKLKKRGKKGHKTFKK